MAEIKTLKLTTSKTKDGVDALKDDLALRAELWAKCSPEKRKSWIDSGKDPVMARAWELYEYLHGWFEGVK